MSLTRYQRAVRNLGGFAGGTSRLARPPAVLEESDVRPGAGCPQEMFTSVAFYPYYYFAGPSRDETLLWTFGPEDFPNGNTWNARSHSPATLATVTTLGPYDQETDLAGIGGQVVDNGGANHAVDASYIYFITELGTVRTLKRLAISGGTVSSLFAFDSSDIVRSLMFCPIDGRLYLILYDDSAGTSTLRAINVDGTGLTAALSPALGAAATFTNVVWADGRVWVLGENDIYAYSIAAATTATIAAANYANGGYLHSNGSVVRRYQSNGVTEWYWEYTTAGESAVTCPDFTFTSGGAPYVGRQADSGVSWFHSDFGTVGRFWRFA